MIDPIPAIPPLTPVSSSNIEAIGHDGDNLHVQFKGGGHYVYQGVPASVHAAALAAPSVGKFINANVRGKYGHAKA